MKTGIFKRLVRWMSAWAWGHEIATCEGVAVLKGINMEDGVLDTRIQQDPHVAHYVAKCFAALVANSPNYTEMRFDLNGKYLGNYEWMTIHIQKGNGKTPHELRLEAAGHLRSVLARIREWFPERFDAATGGMPDTDLGYAIQSANKFLDKNKIVAENLTTDGHE